MLDNGFVRKAFANMIIVDEIPFSHMEHEGFQQFCKAINPQFFIPSRSTVTRDCYRLYIEERKKLQIVLSELTSRVCLTTNTWTLG